YYDTEQRRAGLPRDVAALVRGLDAESVTVSLVNLSVRHTREVVIGAGSFGEHRFTSVREISADGSSGEAQQVHGPWLNVKLPPGSEIELELGMERHCRQPTYAFPWHGDTIPVR
ncbi:MAG: hypothetical protein HOC05_16450, partial [Gemmatimonadetes bacterium]|nr:hypothetical protein [Gemmatimonadota bacterium]